MLSLKLGKYHALFIEPHEAQNKSPTGHRSERGFNQLQYKKQKAGSITTFIVRNRQLNVIGAGSWV